jgi:hypothetical protein
MVLAQKQTGRPMEQNDGEKTASSRNVAGKTGYVPAEN